MTTNDISMMYCNHIDIEWCAIIIYGMQTMEL